MASSTSKTFIPDLEVASERVREANDRVLEASRKITSAYLDGVERYFDGVTEFERKFGEQSQVEAVSTLLNAHAKMTDDVAKAGVSAARALIAQ